jgi:hypothetical protein
MNFTSRAPHSRAALAIASTLIAASLCSSGIAASVVLRDQYAPSNPTAGNWTQAVNTRQLGQTFPVTLDGYLDSVEIYVNHQTGVAGNMSWDVRPTSGVAPANSDATILASGSMPISSLPEYWNRTPVRLDVAASQIRVRPGDLFAVTIRVSGSSGAFWLYHDESSPGEMFARTGSPTWTVNTFSPTSAYGFATYVLPVPEPTCACLLSLMLAPILVAARRRRKLSDAALSTG